jgi:hypothetical protein
MSILILSVVLTAGMVLMMVFIKDLKQSVETSLSVQAFYAADSAMEWQLYAKFNPNSSYAVAPIMNNSTSFEYATSNDQILQTIGTIGNVSRGIQTNF